MIEVDAFVEILRQSVEVAEEINLMSGILLRFGKEFVEFSQFTQRMLAWPPGPRDSDGVWAPHWYAAVWESTGFQPWRPREATLSDHDAAVAEACRPIYEALHDRRVRV